MYFLILSLPLIGTIFSGLFGYWLGAYGATRITVICMTLTFCLSCFAFYEVALAGSPCYFEFFKWFDSELITFSWGFLFDTLTVVMLVVVTSISMCVHLYSTEYMSADPHIQRFMSYLSLFTFFMIILVTADNFFQMFLGWEGVGLCSYLLVNFWFGRLQANKAALKAMVVNRIGDIGLALAVFLIYYVFKAIDYATVFALTPQIANYTVNFFGFECSVISLICFFFFIAATGKSAQIGLHTWLPDAMEGPTPVSALIHAATMVTAGVFLIVRCSPLFEYAPTISLIITISGAMTAFMAASIGLVQNDLKRVIAYSTCSQLGYMMIACGTSGYAVGMFHLTNHAFFKALLFLSAGSIIHALADEQDMRKMGGLLNLLPFTYSMMLIGSLSLMGFPFLTGFYSKDLILEWTYSQFSANGLFAYWLGSISAFFTAFYSLRVICLTFLRKPAAAKINVGHVHEAPLKMAAPLLFLAFFSIFIGFIFKDMFVGLGTDFWGNSIFVLPENVLLVEAEFLPVNVKLFPVCLSLLGGTLAFIGYNFFFKLLYSFKISFIGRQIYIFFNRKWFFDKLYNYFFAHRVLVIGYRHAYQNIDRGLLELLGPTGLWTILNKFSLFLNLFYNRSILSINRIKGVFNIFFIMLSGLFILNVVTMYLIEGTFFYSINMLFNKTLGLLNSYSQIGYRTFKNVISQPSRYNFDALIEMYNVLRNGIFVLYKDFNSMALWANVFETGFTPRIDATPVTGMEALTSFQKVQRELNPIFSLSSDFNIYLNPQDQLMFSILGGPEKIESREAFLSEYFGLSREFFENEKYVIKHTDINAKEFYDKLWEILQKLPYDNGGYLFESSLQFADSIQREFLLKDLFQQENLRQFSRQIPKLLSDHGVFINPENLSGFGLDPLYINPIKPNGGDSFGGMIQRPSIEEIEAMLENATPKLTCEGEEYQIAQKTDAWPSFFNCQVDCQVVQFLFEPTKNDCQLIQFVFEPKNTPKAGFLKYDEIQTIIPLDWDTLSATTSITHHTQGGEAWHTWTDTFRKKDERGFVYEVVANHHYKDEIWSTEFLQRRRSWWDFIFQTGQSAISPIPSRQVASEHISDILTCKDVNQCERCKNSINWWYPFAERPYKK